MSIRRSYADLYPPATCATAVRAPGYRALTDADRRRALVETREGVPEVMKRAFRSLFPYLSNRERTELIQGDVPAGMARLLRIRTDLPASVRQLIRQAITSH